MSDINIRAEISSAWSINAEIILVQLHGKGDKANDVNKVKEEDEE